VSAPVGEGIEAARALVAEALGLEAGSVPQDARLGEPAAWDSIGHMRIVFAIEERLGATLDAEAIVGIETLADVARALGRAA